MKFAWIKSHCDSFPIATMCRVLQVSRSGFYKWRNAKPSPRAQRTEAIKADILKLFERFEGIYGSYKIAEELKADKKMETACRNTVARAMKEMGLKCKVTRQFQPRTTISDPENPFKNVLNQQRLFLL